MGIQVCVKLSVAIAALLLGWSAAHAVPLEQWTNRAMDFVAKFEGSDFGAITADVDCQGLSLGKKAAHDQGQFSQEHLRRSHQPSSGGQGLDKIIGETFGDKAAEFSLLVDESLKSQEGPDGPGARAGKRSSKATGGSDLTEGECATGSKRSVSPSSATLEGPLRRAHRRVPAARDGRSGTTQLSSAAAARWRWSGPRAGRAPHAGPRDRLFRSICSSSTT